jgi:hypothetical protein
MTEQELRTLVRDAIAKQATARAADPQPERTSATRLHPSHAVIALPVGSDGDGLCIIEPAVSCNHCGYCKSLGH